MEDKDNPAIAPRDVLLKEINKEIDDVVAEINSFEKLRLLSGIGSFLDGGIQYLRPTLPNILETTMEYAQSIASSFENDYDAPIPSAEDIAVIHGKLEKIRAKYLEYVLTEDDPKKYSSREQNLRSRVIENTLTVRGEGYRVHVDEVFLELFEKCDELLLKQYGFDSESILSVIEYIEGELKSNRPNRDRGYKEFIKWMNSQDMGKLVMKHYDLPRDPFMFPKIFQRETGKVIPFKLVDEVFKFDVSDLTYAELQVITALSISFGDNAGFLNPRFNAHLLNDTLVTSKPIIYSPERESYYCFSTKILHRNIFVIGEELVKEANEVYFQNIYLGKGANGRSTYFEEKVCSLFSKIMPFRKPHCNLKYKLENQEFEIDLLIETDNFIVLAEVKSGLYSNAAKRGAIKNLKNDVKDFVGDAADQVSRTENYIKTQIDPSFYYKDGRTVNVCPNKTFLKFVVPFASIVGITNQLRELSQIGIVGSLKGLPISISVFDLMVLADIFNNDEKEFIEYALTRLSLNEEADFKIENELDFLGLYLSRDLRKIMKVFKRDKSVTVDSKFRKSLDNYYEASYEGIPWKVPKKVI